MKKLIPIFLLLLTLASANAQSPPLTFVEYVKIIDPYEEEALFYYEQNWKFFRDAAHKKGYVSGYLLLKVEDVDEYDLLLVTSFASSEQYDEVEDRFKEIMGVHRPDGPKLLNEITPSQFRKNVKVENGNVLEMAAPKD